MAVLVHELELVSILLILGLHLLTLNPTKGHLAMSGDLLLLSQLQGEVPLILN